MPPELERIMNDPNDEELGELMHLRGGCRCSWAGASPPCNVCTDPVKVDEAQEVWEIVQARAEARRIAAETALDTHESFGVWS